MKINLNRRLALLSLGLIFLSGCLVKPPPDDNLGPAIDIESINNAMIQAQAGVDPQKGFMLGDSGTVLTVDSTTSTSQISETDLFSITATTATSFTVQEIANLAATPTAPASSTTTTTNYYRPGSEPSSSPTPTPTPVPHGVTAGLQPKKSPGFLTGCLPELLIIYLS